VQIIPLQSGNSIFAKNLPVVVSQILLLLKNNFQFFRRTLFLF